MRAITASIRSRQAEPVLSAEERKMNKDTFPFVVYLIHACADRWGKTPKQVYNELKATKCIEQYLVPNYEILHTQGSNYLVDDIREYLNVRGITV